jgi:hypothetical protein
MSLVYDEKVMRSDVCFTCFYMRPKCVIPITWCTWHQVLCGCACTRVYVHTQSNWILYEIRFKVSTLYAHPSYLLLIASDILLRKSVWYLRSTWRRHTWILAPSLIWVAVRLGDDRQVRHRLLQCLALARRAIFAGIQSRQYHGLWHSPPRLKLSGWSHAKQNL